MSVPHRSGLEAKSRTEDETGIVFLQPQHMQHGVYTILSRWWTTRKKELKKQLEMCARGVLRCLRLVSIRRGSDRVEVSRRWRVGEIYTTGTPSTRSAREMRCSAQVGRHQ